MNKMKTDDLNPKMMLQTIDSSLILDIANGKIDARELARKEMAARGIGPRGDWVGFDTAEEEWAEVWFREMCEQDEAQLA